MAADTCIATLECGDDELTGVLDPFQVAELHGTEAIGQLFRFDAHLVCRTSGPQAEVSITEDQLLGAVVTLRLVYERDEAPTFVRHGMVSEAKMRRLDDADGHTTRISLWLTIVPRLWRATLITTHEIYLNMGLAEIVSAKLESIALDGAFEMRLLREYHAAQLISQVAESDITFLSRWLEREGIGFYFAHTGAEDVVVFADAIEAYGDSGDVVGLPTNGTVELSEIDLRVTRHGKLVSRFYGVDDYNYRTPRMSLLHMHELEEGYAGGVLEYGSHHKTPQEAERQATLRAEASMLERRHFTCEGANPAICAGFRYRLVGSDGQLQELLVVEASHKLSQSLGMVDTNNEAATVYENTFVAVPADGHYRPPRKTPWPHMSGLRTGVIQPGPGGKTNGVAMLDADGRYTVQLHYDSLGTDRTKSSHPVRMAQPFAGPNQGLHFPLRPGTEVLLAYVNGDPDRPVIVSAIPNAETRSPVRADSANRNRITTASGVKVEISEGR